jgi:CD109 antigen
MSSKLFLGTLILLATALVASVLPGCRPVTAIESYVAIVPKVLYSGSRQAVSLALCKGDQLVRDNVEVTLLKEGREVVTAQKTISGKGTVEIDIPEVEEGEYEIKIKGTSFEDRADVAVEKGFLIFLETDKPIYKPGQTVHIRALSLDAELKPVSESVTIEVLDAKGIKIYRSEVGTDDYGMASLDLPVSTEPNTGVWKINAVTDKAKTQLDIRVEKYVLPKYEVKIELPREWFLVSESIQGNVSAEYSFGKPVKGELEIIASRYVGEWQEYATFSTAIEGSADFNLPPVRYVAGVPAAGGMGNLMLEIAVREKATGYEEKVNKLLTVSESPLNIQVIPESTVFKPGLPFSFLIITESPDNEPLDAVVKATIAYLDGDYKEIDTQEKEITTRNGKALVSTTPPAAGVAMIIEVTAEGAVASKIVEASYSPSGNFIHVEQTSEGIPQIGEQIKFRVYSTGRATNFYYEVVSRNKVVFTDFTKSNTIAFNTTPLMAPTSKLLVYQILPNSEVAADNLPFKVEEDYPHDINIGFSKDEARPGDEIDISILTEGQAKVGIAAVDKSVFILAENRLNLQQVFDELERLYMEPQVELHEVSIYPSINTRGAVDIFKEAGVVVLSNSKIPEGKEYDWSGEVGIWDRLLHRFLGMRAAMVEEEAALGVKAGQAPSPSVIDTGEGLAEVQRIRQYFPETWLWKEVMTDASGQARFAVEVPDTITTWMLHAVGISREKGLGVADAGLVAFQPFFLKVDLPYSAIRGEEFPVSVAVYNYLEQAQSVLVEIEEEDWFELLDEPEKTVDIMANDIGAAEFRIRPRQLGINELKVTARSREAADAVIKSLIIAAEGVEREFIDNFVLSDGDLRTIEAIVPLDAVDGSGRAYITLTSSYLTQTIAGLEELLRMPFGCGEQNMMMFAPDAYITRYLQESGQLKPEIMAKAEKLMITGYQRELTYRHHDGSFSAFGESDEAGSLWLTAFVLKCFAQARDLIYIDDSILNEAKAWLADRQNKDGSFDSIGFVHHREMVGGLTGKNALTAFTAIALMEAGERTASARAVDYLESRISEIDDAYTLAITTYALELAGSDKANEALQKLMELSQEDEEGLHWITGGSRETLPEKGVRHINQSADIEATAYATLALIKDSDMLNASRAAKWLVSRRNAYGGYDSTQDTVVALQALTEYSSDARADVDLTINIGGEGISQQFKITQENFDVLQVIAIPTNEEIEVAVTGEGEAIAQVVTRFNLRQTEQEEAILSVNVDYEVTEIEVNDQVKVSVELGFNPPIPMEAGMVVLDVSVPTGFAPVEESLARVIEEQGRIKRYEIAGRKVIFYIENMLAGDTISFSFYVKAIYPVRAKGVVSQAYSYYQPEIRGETLSASLNVR